MNFRLFGSAIFYASILFCMSAHGADDNPDDLVNLAGIDSTRGQSYSTEKEVVDTFSGNLNAIYTDLVVPGTGLDIRIDRHYTTEESGAMVSPIGIRWYIHFGYLQYSADRNPCFDLGGDANNNPVFVTPSGTREKIFYDYIYLDENVDGEFTENVDYKPPMYTSNLWHGECINNNEELVLSDPSGIKYYIDVRSKHISNYHAYKIEDNFGNNLLIDLSVQATSLGDMVKVNNVTASDGRIVTFNYAGSKLSTISYDDKLITYTVGSTPNILGLLESVDIGEDQKWVYTYHPYTSVFNLASVTSPLGKVVTYDYSRFPVAGIQPLMLSQKCIGEICESYSYVHSDSDGSHTTTITGTQWVKQYIHYGYRDTAPSEIWKYGLLKQSCHAKTLGACEGDDMMVSFGGNYSNDGEIQSYVWQPILISNENSNSIIFGTRFNNSNYYVPRLSTKEIKRGTNTYTTQYNYDRLGRSTGWVESGNKVRTFKQYRRDYLSRTQWFMRDASVSVSEGRSTNFSYLYEVNHDDNGQIQEEIKDGAKFNYSYNSDGSLNTVTDGVGNKTVYSRYVQGVARKIEYADASTLTRTVDSHGRITSVTDAKGIKTTYKYDDIDRKTKVDFSHGADISISYETYSDQIKAGIGASSGYSVSVTRDSLKVVQEFDSFGNETKVVKSGNAGSVAINRKYDDQNRLEFKSYPNENSKGIRYSYDTLGRIIKTKSTEGITTRVYYHNGYQVQHKDAKSHSTRTQFTAYGSPDDQYLSEVDAPEQALTNITRNVNGQPLLIKMGDVTREYKYDGNWRLWRYSDSENNAITEYIHDDAGRRVSESKITDDSKLTSIMEYDNLNRLIKITSPSYTLFEGSIRYSSPSSSECGNSCVYIKNHPSYEFSYDLNNNLIKKTKKTEKLTTRIYANIPNISLNSSSNIWNYSYDEKDNLKNETLVNGNNSYDFSYVYNDLDNLESITYPTGLKINYDPDDFGQATKVGDFVNSITYFDSGDIASLVYANGHTTRYSQNERFLPASMKIDGLLDYAYEYDPNGNITNIIDGLDGDHSASMEYDGLNRLISATGEWGNGNYIYDVLGNILSKSIGAESKSYKYNNNNQLIKVGNDTILNDEFGRVIDDGRNTLSFDTDNNLIRAINNKNYNTLFFDYDAANRLITRTEGDRESRFTYTQSGKLMYEVGNDGSFKRNHIYVGNRLVAYDDTGIPCSHDADNDGLPYCFEVDNNLNPTDSTDANQDLDNDGLSNYQEYLAKTNINKADTDSDGIDDNYEVNYQLNPFFDDASQDNDNDGYSNLDEFNLNLNPNIYDKPIAVENIQFSPKKNKALIAWHYPNENFTFDIYWDTKPIVDIDDANLLANASSPVVLNNLVNDQVHYFVVSVSNVAGEKSLSSEYSFTPGIVALVNTGISLDVCDECVLWSKEDDFGNLFLLWADKTSKKLNIRRLDRSGNWGGLQTYSYKEGSIQSSVNSNGDALFSWSSGSNNLGAGVHYSAEKNAWKTNSITYDFSAFENYGQSISSSSVTVNSTLNLLGNEGGFILFDTVVYNSYFDDGGAEVLFAAQVSKDGTVGKAQAIDMVDSSALGFSPTDVYIRGLKDHGNGKFTALWTNTSSDGEFFRMRQWDGVSSWLDIKTLVEPEFFANSTRAFSSSFDIDVNAHGKVAISHHAFSCAGDNNCGLTLFEYEPATDVTNKFVFSDISYEFKSEVTLSDSGQTHVWISPNKEAISYPNISDHNLLSVYTPSLLDNSLEMKAWLEVGPKRIGSVKEHNGTFLIKASCGNGYLKEIAVDSNFNITNINDDGCIEYNRLVKTTESPANMQTWDIYTYAVANSSLLPTANIEVVSQGFTTGYDYVINLSAAGSTDPNGGKLSYSWSNATASNGLSEAIKNISWWEFGNAYVLVELVVTNEQGQKAYTSKFIKTEDANHFAQAVVNNGQVLKPGDEVRFDGTGSVSDTNVWNFYNGFELLKAENIITDTPLVKAFIAPAVNAVSPIHANLTAIKDVQSGYQANAYKSVLHVLVPTDYELPEITPFNDLTVNEFESVNLVVKYSIPTTNGANQSLVKWTQLSGPQVSLVDAQSANISFTAPMVSQDEVITLGVRVTDGKGVWSDETLTVNINKDWSNTNPIANAGSNFSVNEGANFTLDAKKSSQPNGSGLTYIWQQLSGPSVPIADDTKAQLTLSAPEVDGNQTLQFRLTVTNEFNLSAQDTISVQVIDLTNTPPVAHAGDDQTVQIGDRVVLDFSQSYDPDGGGLSMSIGVIQGSGFNLEQSPAGAIEFTAPTVSIDTEIIIRLTVTDSGGAVTTDDVSIFVKAASAFPMPTAHAGADQTVIEGATVNLDGSASSVEDGTSITSYAWSLVSGPNITVSNANTINASFVAPDVSNNTQVTLKLKVEASNGESSEDFITVTIQDTANTFPIANAGNDQTTQEGNVVNLTASASSAAEGTSITSYSWSVLSGPSVSLLNASSVNASFTAPEVSTDTQITLKLTVTASNGESAEDLVLITVENTSSGNVPPVANAGVDQTVDEGATVIIDGRGSNDPDGLSLNMSWSILSGGSLPLANGPEPGTLQFIAPNVSSDKTYTLRLTVTDGEGATHSDDISITVVNTDGGSNQAPVAILGDDRIIHSGDTIIIDSRNSTDADGYVAQIGWGYSSPVALSLSQPEFGVLQFVAPTVTSTTTIIFSLKVTDNEGAEDSTQVTLTLMP